MGAMVLLLHDLPDGSWHYDWMLQRAGKPAPLITFRVDQRLDESGVTAFAAQRLTDHRDEYLSYEGPVRGGSLGSVLRVSAGTCDISLESPDMLRLRCQFHGAPERLLRGLRTHISAGNRWEFCLDSPPDSGILTESNP